MRAWKVAIVGGGPGGLMTAYALQKLASAPLEVTLFEASPRLGGKSSPHGSNAHNVRYEAGAAEFYDYSLFDSDPLKDLIAELGLPIRPMGGPAVIMNEHILANMDDIRDELGPQAFQAVRDFDRQAKDRMTPQEFYHSDDPEGATPAPDRRFDTFLAKVPQADARRYIENLIHSDLATEPRRTSVAYGLQNYLMNDPAYMHLYGIEGGNERLPQELAARIGGTIRLEHAVESVSKVGQQLRVVSIHQGAARQDDFDFVVIALPLGHLLSVAYADGNLAAAMKRHYAQYDHPAHYLRITLLFEQPFWRDAFTDSYWMLDHFGGCCLYDESSRDPGSTHGVLGWLLGGDEAERLSQQSDAELIALALDSLPRFLAHGRHDLIEGRVHRWIGAVNAIPGGLTPATLTDDINLNPFEHPNLYLVGDYLFDSTLNGVLDSAEYVAAWLAAQMADNPTRPA